MWPSAARIFAAIDVVMLRFCSDRCGRSAALFLQGASDPWCSGFLCSGAK